MWLLMSGSRISGQEVAVEERHIKVEAHDGQVRGSRFNYRAVIGSTDDLLGQVGRAPSFVASEEAASDSGRLHSETRELGSRRMS
jgi:hypothetical protein